MSKIHLIDLAERVRLLVKSGKRNYGAAGMEVPIDVYLSEATLKAELDVLFHHTPIPLLHTSELPAPGSYVANDSLGLPLLIVHDQAGEFRVFYNVCRHRGRRLVDGSAPCTRKAIVCPYHSWTYSLAGTLTHVRHVQAFADQDLSWRNLVEVPSAVAHGLVWVQAKGAQSIEIAPFLGTIAQDFAAFGMDDHVVYRRTESTRACNWKLILEAFLDIYHVRVLHKDTIGRFFLDGFALTEPEGVHLRSGAARREVTGLDALPPTLRELRDLISFSHYLFPNGITVVHPDYISLLLLFPLSPSETRWVHLMLVPASENTAERASHWERTYDLIERGVFQREDLATAESIQSGLRCGANQTVLFGGLEEPAVYFHQLIRQKLASTDSD